MSRACVLLLLVSSMLAACGGSPTSPSMLGSSPSGIGATSLADPTLSGTAYQLTAVTSTTMSFTNNQNSLTVPYDANTTFRRAQLNLYAPSDPYLSAATAYNNVTTVDASVLATFIGGNARIIVQRLPDPIRILSFQPIPTIGSGGGPGPCTPGAPGCGWSNGDMTTGRQSAWGDSASAVGVLLSANFNSFYPNDFTVGGTNTLTLRDAPAVFTFLPQLDPAGVLTGDVVDPLTTSAAELAGEVTALKLNIDFSSLLGNAVPLGGLRLCNVTAVPAINGQTVVQFLATANQILSGDTATMSPSTTASVARLINGAFVDGIPSTFAQASLVNGACP